VADSSVEDNVYGMADGDVKVSDYGMAGKSSNTANYDTARGGATHVTYNVGTNPAANAVYDTAGAATAGDGSVYGRAGADGNNVNATYALASKSDVAYAVAGGTSDETDDADYGLARRKSFGSEPHYALEGIDADERDYDAGSRVGRGERLPRPASNLIYDFGTGGGVIRPKDYESAAEGAAATTHAVYDNFSATSSTDADESVYETGSGATDGGATYDVAETTSPISVITPEAYAMGNAAVCATYDVAEEEDEEEADSAAMNGAITPATYEAGAYDDASDAIAPMTYEPPASYDHAGSEVTPAVHEKPPATYDEAGKASITPTTYEPVVNTWV